MNAEQISAQRIDTRNWYVLVTGIPVADEPVALAPGVTLRPLPFQLTVFDVMAAESCGFHGASALSHLIYSATAEIETSADNAIENRFDAIGRAWLASCLLFVGGCYRIECPAALSRSWSDLRRSGRGTWKDPCKSHEISLRTDLSVSGMVLDLHTKSIKAAPADYAPDLKHAGRSVIELFDVADRLCAESEQFRFALQAVVDWRYSPDARAALARIWAGIESLLGISAEISYRASLACAALLEQMGAARLDLFKKVRSLYNRRSKAVHGDAITPSQLADALMESFQLLARLIVFCVKYGRVPTQEDQETRLLAP